MKVLCLTLAVALAISLGAPNLALAAHTVAVRLFSPSTAAL